MSGDGEKSWTSEDTSATTSGSTLNADVDPKDLFKGVVAGINFRSKTRSASIKIEKNHSVGKIIALGPDAILGDGHSEMRWIHLPVNCMEWVEDLMNKIDDERREPQDQGSPEDDIGPKAVGILRNDVWKQAFHGRRSAGIHSRFMRPLCARYSSAAPEDPESDDSDSLNQNMDVLVVHLPYLHWEAYNTWKERQQHIAQLKKLDMNKEQCKCLDDHKGIFDTLLYKGEILLHKRLFHHRPVHDRRSLDQSYLYNLPKVAYRDDDQVIGQHTWRNRCEPRDVERKMMMVDQLWMWVIDGNTVVTSFPETGFGKGKEADVLEKILADLKPSLGQSTKSLNGLIALIVDHCTGVFHRSDIDPKLAFYEIFAEEIGIAKSEVDGMYESFDITSQSIEKLWLNPNVSTRSMTEELDSLFSVKEQLKLLRRVEKIMSDLHKIDFLCSQQTDVLYTLSKPSSRSSRSLTELFETAKHRRKMWADMAATAQDTRDSLHNLLDLKQRQANVSEARTVRYQVEISAQQGQSILLLTIVTIVFLPVSVVAAIFGMNAIELGQKGSLHLGMELTVMALFCFVVILLIVGLFFGGRLGGLVRLLFRNLPL